MRPDMLRTVLFVAAFGICCACWLARRERRRTDSETADAPTFSRDVAPIFYNKCVSCHRPGEVAPMSLITYRDVRPWASAIREKVTTRVMPPWHADRQYGTFRNDLSLTQREIDTIAAWVGAGANEGNPSELPALPKFPEGWQIGTPDQVFEMQADYQVPATGTIDYQYFEVPTNFTEDKWMQAGEVRAGDRAHVHHIIVYVREPQREQPSERRECQADSSRRAGACLLPPARAARHDRPRAFSGARRWRCNAGELGRR